MRLGQLWPGLAVTAGLWGAQAADQMIVVKPPVVRAVEFKNFHGVTAKEIGNRLSDRDIQLLERPYNPGYVETAQGIVEELLKEKGLSAHVKTTIARVSTHTVRLTFTAAP